MYLQLTIVPVYFIFININFDKMLLFSGYIRITARMRAVILIYVYIAIRSVLARTPVVLGNRHPAGKDQEVGEISYTNADEVGYENNCLYKAVI